MASLVNYESSDDESTDEQIAQSESVSVVEDEMERIESQQKTVVHETPVVQQDFFGLENSDSGSDSEDNVPKARQLDSNSEIPSTNYWKDFQPKIQEKSEETFSEVPSKKRKLAKVPFVSGGFVGDESPARKRKIYFVHHLVAQNLNREFHSLPMKEDRLVPAHEGVVNSVKWCKKRDYSHLAATAGSDNSVKLWNMLSDGEACLGTVYRHEKSASSLAWSQCGRHILSGGYDRTAVIIDVETNDVINVYPHTNHVTKVVFNPSDHRLFATINHDVINAWDTRAAKRKPCRSIRHPKQEVTSFLDFTFLNDAKELFVSTDSCEHNLCVFDLGSGGLVSFEKEIFPERYTCPRLALTPASKQHRYVMAQTQGDYICEFSTRRPYKLNRTKRFHGHRVAGYPVGFDITRDGRTVVSGSADSKLHLYDWSSGRGVGGEGAAGTVQTGLGICTDVSCHPVLGNVVLAGSWNGKIALFK